MIVSAIGLVLLGLAALIVLLNGWLLIRGLLAMWLGRDWRYISIIPVIGQLLAIVAAFIFFNESALFRIAVFVALLDTGGLHAFVLFLGLMYFREFLKK
jgi:hypothetical protein